jgi:hypothetical protein
MAATEYLAVDSGIRHDVPDDQAGKSMEAAGLAEAADRALAVRYKDERVALGQKLSVDRHISSCTTRRYQHGCTGLTGWKMKAVEDWDNHGLGSRDIKEVFMQDGRR